MSKNQRMGLLVAAGVVVVVAIVVAVASGGSDDTSTAGSTSTTAQTTVAKTETTSTKTSTEEPHETVPAEPRVHRIEIRGGQPVGGVQDIKVKKGDEVTIVVSADAEDDIHLHGYDIEKPVEPGKPATFKFKADIEGIFEMESHVAEDAGREPLMGKLTVEPS
jgi:FtsP/CotA-like multicopper oxidase with cupredoxin domain